MNNLPPGVTAMLSNDTLTISGTISTEGLNSPQITTDEGCSKWFIMDMSLIVDPGFACNVEGEDVILHWPGMNATLEWGGEVILLCTTTDGFIDSQTLFLPCPDPLVWTGLPTNTELTFGMTGTGDPYCFPGYFETSCTIITADVLEHEKGDLVVRAITTGDLLQLSADAGLGEARIYDMLGGLMASHRVNARTTSVPIGMLAPGAYVLRVMGTDGRVSAQRFVKE